ncbi:RNA-directed DNA polymerase [uncultured Tenacibaculum sp.]|uniref:RNA-directed DNA polymerase n=1 Tax=uncultured Tenacibaculum sp. TaxID=174713 RepID=UPI00262C4392|nr:RNA-directed DNA polymerase [uncultured Tenacibaculum sp.]
MEEIDENVIYQKLLDFGLFPEKIDKIFSSELYGKWVRDNGITVLQNRVCSNIVFRLTRNNNAPRILSIPHPIAYNRLALEIKNNWSSIFEKIGEVDDYYERSMVIPKPNNLNNRLVSMLSYERNKDQKFLSLDKSFQAKYLVHADIANCYPSIYSHSIPWALVGKIEAKANSRNRDLWYNKLDFAIRSTQRNETVGIPIGPDTSSIISELVLSQIDKELLNYKYFRFIDDYKCYCKSKEEADTFIKKLSKELEKFNLRLNQKKTKIVELPKPIEEEWIRKLKTYSNTFLSSENLDNSHLINISEFIDLAISLTNENPNDSAIKYATRILSKKTYTSKDTLIYLIMYLSRVCFIFPYFIDVFDEILSKNSLDDDLTLLIKKEINSILKEHKEYSRSDVSLWGIQLAIKYNFEIENFEEYSDYLIEERDCLPVLLCYSYSKTNELNLDKYFSLIEQIIEEKIEDEWWLYIYTLFFDAPTKPQFNSIECKELYSKMSEGNVQFLKSEFPINEQPFVEEIDVNEPTDLPF